MSTAEATVQQDERGAAAERLVGELDPVHACDHSCLL
jgi:hypothetical protein